MKRIKLTQGQYAIVDDQDYEWLNQWKWFANKDRNTYYAYRNEQGKLVAMHREIFGLSYRDKKQTDHKDGNGLNNRMSNLRIVTNQQNQFNRKNSPKGYYFNKALRKYKSQIKLNGKSIYLGLFCTIKEAHNAYLEAKKIITM